MVFGLTAALTFAFIYLLCTVYIAHAFYLRGLRAGVVREAKAWIDAINKVTPPNWQTIAPPPGHDPVQSKIAAKVYVEAFKVALEVIMQDVVAKRMDSLFDEHGEATLKD